MLKQVHFAGIKSLLDVTVDLERFTVLVGPNGCGKSTVLDQIEAVCEMTVPEPGASEVLGKAQRVLTAIRPDEIRTSGTDAVMRWRVGSEEAGEYFETVIAPASTAKAHKGWVDRCTVAALAENRTYRLATNGTTPAAKAEIEAVLIRQFSLRSQRLRLTPGAVAADSPIASTRIEPNGEGTPTVLMKLAVNDPDAFRQVKLDMTKVVPQFQSLRIDTRKGTDGRGNPVDVVCLSLQMLGAGMVPANSVSDGTLLALALLTATHNRDLPALILMDDIDHGLHLSAQFQIIEAIRRVMKVREDLQVICTTHAPVLVDSFEPSEVRVMALNKAGRSLVRPLTAAPDFERWRVGMQTGELWASYGEDWVGDTATDVG